MGDERVGEIVVRRGDRTAEDGGRATMGIVTSATGFPGDDVAISEGLGR
jgi:hypothetical protein